MSSHFLPEPNPELVQYAQQRDNGKPTPEACAAFSLLYEYCWSLIYRHFYPRFANEQEAQELAQDTFVKAWYALPDKNPDAPFVGWLMTIAVNLGNDYGKKQRREAQRQVSLDGLLEECRATPENLTYAGTEEQVILADTAERAFQRLSRKDQQLLYARELQGYSEEKTAALTEISPSSVPRMLQRARGRFMDSFNQLWHGLTPIRPRRGGA